VACPWRLGHLFPHECCDVPCPLLLCRPCMALFRQVVVKAAPPRTLVVCSVFKFAFPRRIHPPRLRCVPVNPVCVMLITPAHLLASVVGLQVQFITRVWHPNVDYSTGKPCKDIIEVPWHSSSTQTLKFALIAIRQMLSSPSAGTVAVVPCFCVTFTIVRHCFVLQMRRLSMLRLRVSCEKAWRCLTSMQQLTPPSTRRIKPRRNLACCAIPACVCACVFCDWLLHPSRETI
jgi:hypothetical protein